MSFEALAFFTGLFGSLHCVSMCGPLILMLPFSGQSLWAAIVHRLLYQAGRIVTYGILGLIIGFIGNGFSLLGMQQTLSLLTGILLLLAGMNYFIKGKTRKNTMFPNAMNPITTLLSKYMAKPYGGFIAGALNGLLPCGITYIALAQAINLDTVANSGLSMIYFGLGTLPLLLLTALSPLFFRTFKTPGMLVPLLFIIAGSFLTARGLNLDIPYISHAVSMNGENICK